MQPLGLAQADPVVQQTTALGPQVASLFRDLIDVLIHQLDLVLGTIQIEPGAEGQDPADHRDGSDHEITDELMVRRSGIAPAPENAEKPSGPRATRSCPGVVPSCPGSTRASFATPGMRMSEPNGVDASSDPRVEPDNDVEGTDNDVEGAEDDVEAPVGTNAAKDEPTDDSDTPTDERDAPENVDNIPEGGSKE
jgi:hypothetical protein